jgi:hypothetical protein
MTLAAAESPSGRNCFAVASWRPRGAHVSAPIEQTIGSEYVDQCRTYLTLTSAPAGSPRTSIGAVLSSPGAGVSHCLPVGPPAGYLFTVSSEQRSVLGADSGRFDGTFHRRMVACGPDNSWSAVNPRMAGDLAAGPVTKPQPAARTGSSNASLSPSNPCGTATG